MEFCKKPIKLMVKKSAITGSILIFFFILFLGPAHAKTPSMEDQAKEAFIVLDKLREQIEIILKEGELKPLSEQQQEKLIALFAVKEGIEQKLLFEMDKKQQKDSPEKRAEAEAEERQKGINEAYDELSSYHKDIINTEAESCMDCAFERVNTNIDNPIRGICEIIIHSDNCKDVPQKDLLNCKNWKKSGMVSTVSNQTEEAIGCASGLGESVKDIGSFLWNTLVWAVSPDKRNSTINSANLYLTDEYDKAFDTLKSTDSKIYDHQQALDWRVVRKMSGNLLGKAFSSIKKNIAHEYSEYHCLNSRAKADATCYLLATIAIPGFAGMKVSQGLGAAQRGFRAKTSGAGSNVAGKTKLRPYLTPKTLNERTAILKKEGFTQKHIDDFQKSGRTRREIGLLKKSLLSDKTRKGAGTAVTAPPKKGPSSAKTPEKPVVRVRGRQRIAPENATSSPPKPPKTEASTGTAVTVPLKKAPNPSAKPPTLTEAQRGFRAKTSEGGSNVVGKTKLRPYLTPKTLKERTAILKKEGFTQRQIDNFQKVGSTWKEIELLKKTNKIRVPK